jgi:predicted GIY-YIG superfamily endonuclease
MCLCMYVSMYAMFAIVLYCGDAVDVPRRDLQYAATALAGYTQSEAKAAQQYVTEYCANAIQAERKSKFLRFIMSAAYLDVFVSSCIYLFTNSQSSKLNN